MAYHYAQIISFLLYNHMIYNENESAREKKLILAGSRSASCNIRYRIIYYQEERVQVERGGLPASAVVAFNFFSLYFIPAFMTRDMGPRPYQNPAFCGRVAGRRTSVGGLLTAAQRRLAGAAAGASGFAVTGSPLYAENVLLL